MREGAAASCRAEGAVNINTMKAATNSEKQPLISADAITRRLKLE